MSNSDRRAIVIAVTGGIACGKSEVGRILGEMGFAVCDADIIAHELMARGRPVYERIVECFGSDILNGNGEISRSRLGGIVFDHPERRFELNRLVHPAVCEELMSWISERRVEGIAAAAQVPLLFESGMERLDWDAVLCVSCRDSTIMSRLEARGINRREARLRIESQMELSEKERRSDRVIHNFGTLQELEKVTRETVEYLMLER